MRHTAFAALSSILVLAACTSATSEDSADQAAEQQLTSLSLKCTLAAASAEFDMGPGAGAGLPGKLLVNGQEVDYSCAPTSGDSTNGNPDFACTELPQTVHAGQWSFAVTHGASGYTATLKRGGTSPDLAFACEPGAPSATDAGPGPATDAGTDASAHPGFDAGPGTTQSADTFADVEPLFAANCNGCHHGAFSTLAAVKQEKTKMIQMISSGRMPKNNPGWKDTADGQRALAYLQNSPDLQ